MPLLRSCSTLRKETCMPRVMNTRLMDQTLRSVVFERTHNSLFLPYVSGYIFNDDILQARRFSSVKAHPHPIHILFWSIFFGPIIILMPCLLVLEVTILVLFNLNFITHGLLPGTQNTCTFSFIYAQVLVFVRFTRRQV